MIKNWPTFLEDNSRLPETVAEAVERLIMILDGEQKVALAIMQKEDLIDLHFSLGMAIRNAFGLYESGSELLASSGVRHPDDASMVIISKLWRGLQT